MNVLYVSKALAVAMYRGKLAELSRHLSVTAVIPDRWPGGVEPPGPVDGGVSYRRLPVLFPGHNHFHLYRGAARVLDEVKPDLVHIDEEPYSAVTWQWARLCRRRRVPYLFFAWQNLHKKLPPPFGALRAHVFRGAAGGIAGNEDAAGVLRRAGYRGALTVIPQFGVDPALFRPDPSARKATRERIGAREDEVVIGYVGRLVPEKGVHLLIEALASVPRARLVVLGDGPERTRLVAATANAGVYLRVWFHGQVLPSTEVSRWMAGLDVLALPSLSTPTWVEQFGRVLIEAMACGVPVVGSDSGEIPRVIGDAGVVVPEGDVAALATALRALVDSRERREVLGRRGRERVLRHFTHASVASRTAAFYRQLVAAAAPARAASTAVSAGRAVAGRAVPPASGR